MPGYFCILRLKSGRRYPGATTSVQRRCAEHLAGTACRTTKRDPPAQLIYSEEYASFSEARRREAQVKRWTRAKKEALVAGDLVQLKGLAKRRKR